MLKFVQIAPQQCTPTNSPVGIASNSLTSHKSARKHMKVKVLGSSMHTTVR